jgi:putative oxidoreductase
MPNSTLLLVSRIFLSLLFLFAGFGKLMGGPAGFAGYVGSLGLPAPMLVAWATIALEILGGLAILVGFQTRIAAYALAAFCVASALIAHFDFADQNQATQFLKNLGLAGGFLLLTATGPGSISVEGRRR